LKLELGNNIERETILAEILNIFEGLLLELESKPQVILNEWRAKCQMIGDKITITENDEVKSGIFYDIDENGYLLLKRKIQLKKYILVM